jgi:hypothetical protein
MYVAFVLGLIRVSLVWEALRVLRKNCCVALASDEGLHESAGVDPVLSANGARQRGCSTEDRTDRVPRSQHLVHDRLLLLEDWYLYFVKCFDRSSRKSYDKGKTLQTRQNFLVRIGTLQRD